MRVYTVYEPPNAVENCIERATKLVFIRDRFSLIAALFPPIWMIVNRLWLVLLGYLVATGAIGAAAGFANLAPNWMLLISVAIHLWIGFEAASLRRWTLERRGWRMVGVASGGSLQDCERRFFDNWLSKRPAPASKVAAEGAVPAAAQSTSEAVPDAAAILPTQLPSGSS